MQFGHFDDAVREYVITRPDTPLPWINYLGSQDFFSLITQTSGGYSLYRDARLRRITRFRYNNIPADIGGRFIYLRDDCSGQSWSPSWGPVRRPLESYTCRHGMGYTDITSTYQGIVARERFFVPLGQNLEVWQVWVTNQRTETAEISVFGCVEFCLWDAHDDSTNFQRNFNTGEVEIERGVIFHKTEYRERRDHFAYFACSAPVASFDTQRSSFLGPYRSWENPLAVEQGQCSGSVAHGWSPMAADQVKLTLQPGETRQLVFVLGYAENPQDDKFDPPGSQTINKRRVWPVIEQFTRPDAVEAAFAELRQYWDGLLGTFQVETPSLHTNRMVNIWNAYQCMVTFNMSRSASFFESGVGRGMGFRDSNQDLLGFVHMVPQRARQRILDISATQLPNGGAYHQYQPLTKKGNNDVGSNFNDDPHWLILAVAAYIKETGDWGILDEPVQYDNKPGSEEALIGHLHRCVSYTLERLGPHGLPLIGRADWNDCLNLNCFSDTPGQSFQTTTNKEGKVAESVLIGGLFALSLKALAGLLDTRSADEAARYRQLAEGMAQTVITHGWDGNWFLRAYDDFGDKVGSDECREGKIFIEPQGICSMAGIGREQGLVEKALASVNQHLATPHGIVLQQPAFTHYYLNLGEISSYPPGYKENAGIFCHSNPWIMIAETLAGHGEQALDYYLRINPSAREDISELHGVEPYVYAQMIAGRDASTHGEAKNSWLSGTAAWNYVAITQHILGIRPALDGLEISPVIPADWPGFTARRTWRGVTFNISVLRRGPGNLVSVWADDQRLQGQTVPLPRQGQTEVDVRVVIQ